MTKSSRNVRRIFPIACCPFPVTRLVEGEGFEPSKAEPADLQSAPVDRLGTPPTKPHILAIFVPKCQTAHCFCTVSL